MSELTANVVSEVPTQAPPTTSPPVPLPAATVPGTPAAAATTVPGTPAAAVTTVPGTPAAAATTVSEAPVASMARPSGFVHGSQVVLVVIVSLAIIGYGILGIIKSNEKNTSLQQGIGLIGIGCVIIAGTYFVYSRSQRTPPILQTTAT